MTLLMASIEEANCLDLYLLMASVEENNCFDLYLVYRMTLLLGPPGCGKTTFLLALSGKLDKSLKVCKSKRT